MVVASLFGCALWGIALSILIPWGALAGWFFAARVARALSRDGLTLEFESMQLGWRSATFQHVRFVLAGLKPIQGKAVRVDVRLRNMRPTRIEATGVELEVVGSAASVALELSMVARDHPGIFGVPIEAEAVRVTWADWITISDGVIVATPRGSTFTATADPGGRRVVASWSATPGVVSFTAGTPESKPFQMEVRHAVSPQIAVVTLAQTDGARLAAALGTGYGYGATFSGRAEIELPHDPSQIRVRAEGRVEGWKLEAPGELRGLSLGNVMTFRSDVEVSKDARSISARRIRMQFGELPFHADVSVDGESGYLRMLGAIPCAAVIQVTGDADGREKRGWLPVDIAIRYSFPLERHSLPSSTWRLGSGCGLPIPSDRVGAPARLPQVPPKGGPPAGVVDEMPSMDFIPSERRGQVGEMVSFDARLHLPGKRQWTMRCASPIRLSGESGAPPPEPLSPGSLHVETIVEPWHQDTSLGFALLEMSTQDIGTHTEHIARRAQGLAPSQRLPISALEYETAGPSWIDYERTHGTGPELSYAKEDGEVVVWYRPRPAASPTVRAVLVDNGEAKDSTANRTKLLYVDVAWRHGIPTDGTVGPGPPREDGVMPVVRLSYPAAVALPVHVVLVVHDPAHDCGFRVLETTIR